MAYDLYDDPKFMVGVCSKKYGYHQDPTYDIEAGLKIYIPKIS